MKKAYLAYDFLKKNIAPLLIVICALTMSMFTLVTVYGKYRYQVYARDIYDSSTLQNAVFFYYDVADMSNGRDAAMKECEAFIDTLAENFPEINNIGYTYDMALYGADTINIKYLSDDFIEAISLPVIEGRWLNSSGLQTEAVVGGAMFDNVKIGDTIEIIEGINATVVGRMSDLVISPSLSSYGTYLCADDLFKVTGSSIFVNSGTKQIDGSNYSLGWFIGFDSQIDLERKDECLAFLRENGKYYTYDQIMENTDNKIRTWIHDSLPFPLFTISAATLLVFTLIVVIIQKNRNDHSKYYIIGSSKKELVFIAALAMSVVIFIPCGINLFLAIFYPNFLRVQTMALIDYIIDLYSIIPLLLYGALIFLSIIFITIMNYRKYSPIDLYRNQE